MNAKAGEHRRSEICGLDVTISVRYGWSVASFHYVIGISGILPYSRNVTLQVTTGMLPYQHSSRALEIFTAYTVLSHGSIMLPPRQPRVFARLARWQLIYRLCHFDYNFVFVHCLCFYHGKSWETISQQKGTLCSTMKIFLCLYYIFAFAIFISKICPFSQGNVYAHARSCKL